MMHSISPAHCLTSSTFLVCFKLGTLGTSLVVYWLRIQLPLCRGQGFSHWSRKIPHAARQLSLCALEPVPRSERKPLQCRACTPDRERSLLSPPEKACEQQWGPVQTKRERADSLTFISQPRGSRPLVHSRSSISLFKIILGHRNT